jgi:CubicO group peptidase (beta-lactamase class C family)
MSALRVVIALLLAATPSFAQDTARMEQVIQSYVKNRTFMGTVLVARGSDVILDKGYGSANLEWDVPNAPTTKFRLGSITKQFTAASILLLEERGTLKVEDPITKYIPDAAPEWGRITIYNLLTHTSGIPNFTSLPEYSTLKTANTPVEKTIASFKAKPLDFGPGEKMSYSNSGYLVLGYVIEKVTGASYGKFVLDNLFTPLGMKDSGYDSNTAVIGRRASGYAPGAGGLVNAGYVHMSIPHAAGALYSTTEDLLKWEQALFAGKLVSAASLERMTTPFKNDYAFGLTVRTDKGRKVIAHNGGIDGFNTSMAYYPETKTVVIVLANVNGPAADTLGAQLGAIAHGDPVKLTSERTEIALPVATLSKYVGAYELAPTATMTITLDGDHLMAQLTGQGKNQIFRESETLFFLKVVDAQIEFAADASYLVLHQNGRDLKGNRK